MLSEGLVLERDTGPAQPTLIYDAECGFCRRWVGRVRVWDRRKVIRYLPLRDPEAPAVAGRPLKELTQAVHLAKPDGSVFAGAAAARELFGYMPLGGALRVLMGLPGVRPACAKAYAWLARRHGPVR